MSATSNEQKLLLHELKDPQKQLNFVFLLIGVIPVLACVYIVLSPTLGRKVTSPEMVPILFFANVLMVLGYAVGYKVLRKVLQKAQAYATRAKRSEQMRARMAAALAHDLKSPLAVIKANMANLRAGNFGPLDPKQKEMSELCSGVADRTASILMDLIKSYSPGDPGHEPEMHCLDLNDIAKEQWLEINAIAQTKNLDVKSSFFRSPLMVNADRSMMARAVHNVLSNAVKYTPPGGRVALKTSLETDFAQVEVINTGDTIPEKSLEKIFESGERLGRSEEGEGLGLAITRAIVETHHGKVWAESDPGRNNRFTILLPLTASGKLAR